MSLTDLWGLVAQAGVNDAWYEDPHLPGRPVLLRAARPERYSPATPLLFAHHGDLRNGGDYRDYWLPLVDEAKFLSRRAGVPVTRLSRPGLVQSGQSRR